MTATPPPEVDERSAAALLPAMYEELKRLATNLLNRESVGQTLQPTALVHEAYLRVIGRIDAPRWDNRGHFFAAAAQAMRRILVDNARRKKVFHRITTSPDFGRRDGDGPPTVDLLALDEALDQLSQEDAMAARVVELRYFAGLTIDQATDVLGVSRYEVNQKWTYARSWLRLALDGPPPKG
jgi:RNA polymerase sigma factor (TIGR02999 family)